MENAREELQPLRLDVGTRVLWDDRDGLLPGVITGKRENGDLVIKLDGGGTFAVPRYQLQRIA